MHVETYLNVDFSSLAKSKYKSKFNFELAILKKIQIFGIPCCSTREVLSIDVSITNIGLILKSKGDFFSWVQTLWVATDKIQFRTFLKNEIQIYGFPCSAVVATREDLSIDVSITNVRVILTKLR